MAGKHHDDAHLHPLTNVPTTVIIRINTPPQAIRTIESISGFRKQLKTYLFRLAYPPP